MITGRLRGLGAAIEDLTRRADRGADRGMARASRIVADAARREHEYENHTRNLERATQPAPVQGRLRDGNLTGGVVAAMGYGSYVDARKPFLLPAFERAKDEAEAALGAALDDAFKGTK
jgi:hypothetical protein